MDVPNVLTWPTSDFIPSGGSLEGGTALFNDSEPASDSCTQIKNKKKESEEINDLTQSLKWSVEVRDATVASFQTNPISSRSSFRSRQIMYWYDVSAA